MERSLVDNSRTFESVKFQLDFGLNREIVLFSLLSIENSFIKCTDPENGFLDCVYYDYNCRSETTVTLILGRI